MIGFGMKNTLVSFIDKYYEYGGEMEDEKRGLTIGGYESAWLADLVAAYLLEMTKEKFDNFVYHGIYRNDGFMVLKGTRMEREMNDWLEDFQEKINKMTESTCLQFTAEVWGIEKDPEVKNNRLEVVNEKVFPYLDMEMRWNEKEELRFQVHMKPNQKLKYLNNDSTHTQVTFKAILNGVLGRLNKLTSRTKELENVPIDKIYPHHAKALQIAGIAPKTFPTFRELDELSNKLTPEEKGGIFVGIHDDGQTVKISTCYTSFILFYESC